MSTTTLQPYTDTPAASPHQPPKPLPDLPPYSPRAPYRDDPSAPHPAPPHVLASETPYSDTPPTLSHPLSTHTETHTIPLAHLVPPLDLPPSYATAIHLAYRDTLRPHMSLALAPPRGPSPSHDAEAGHLAWAERPDDVRHAVEKVVAMFVVASVLLVVSGVLGWLVVLG
ncbi:hypothetical protein ACN47E_006104 [Coniothyrium glycines]